MPLRLTLSLGLNALLLGLVLWLVWPASPSAARSRSAHFLVDRVARVKPQLAPLPVEEASPEVVAATGPFHWAQLESADYRVYLANLRDLGCPESTVRDILIADVNELFAGRIKALVDEVNGRFWPLISRQDDFMKMVDRKENQLRELRQERDELLTVLFGNANPLADEDQRAVLAIQRGHWERLSDFLPAEKRAQFVATKEELERAWTDFLRMPGLTGTQQQAKRKELEAIADQSLRDGLTPDEYNELRLRQSPAANLRERLVGSGLSEDEVRAAAEIQLATDEARTALSPKDADFKSRTAQLQQQAEAQTRERLGPEAYAALQRATDHRYEPFYRVTQRLELPDSAAAQAYDIRRQAEEAANQVQADPSLAVEERQAQLRAIGTETKQSLSATLGAKGMTAYENLDGGWMQQLNSVK